MNHYNNKVLIGLFVLLLLLYNRLFRVRLDKPLDVPFDIIKSIIYGVLFIITISMCIKNIITFYKWWKNNTESENTSKIYMLIKSLFNPFIKIIQYFLTSLQDLDAYIKNHSMSYNDNENYAQYIIQKLGLFLHKNSKYTMSILFVIIMLCHIIPVIFLYVDIFIFAKISYFYKTLWILIFPMIVTYFIYSIRADCQINLIELSNMMDIKIVKNTGERQKINYDEIKYIDLEHFYFLRYKDVLNDYFCMHTLKPQLLKEDTEMDPNATLQYCTAELHKLLDMRTFVDTYDNYSKKYLSIFNAVKYLLYAICWMKLLHFTIFI